MTMKMYKDYERSLIYILFYFGLMFLDRSKYSWGENYAGSSGLQSPLPASASGLLLEGTTIDQLEMDKFDQQLTYFPFLYEPNTYVPDTVDLTQDKEAR